LSRISNLVNRKIQSIQGGDENEVIGAFLLFAANAVFAASVCPIVTGGGTGGVNVNPAYAAFNVNLPNIGCNVLFTFNPDLTVTISNPNTAVSYDDGIDDNLVGVINNTGSPIFSIPLTSTGAIAIFGFDGDGICDDSPGWTFSPVGAGGTTPCGSPVPGGYGHPGVTFSGISPDQRSGTVNFAGGIPSGGSNWFSLEGPANTAALGNPPEPGTIILMGSGLAGVLAAVRRRRMAR